MKIHKIPFSLLGVYTELKDYEEGDLIQCGDSDTMLYYPVSGSNIIKNKYGDEARIMKTPYGWSCWIS